VASPPKPVRQCFPLRLAKQRLLRRVAKDGRDAFYSGEIAEDMVASLSAQGGLHNGRVSPPWAWHPRRPIASVYQMSRWLELRRTGQGPPALLMMNMLVHSTSHQWTRGAQSVCTSRRKTAKLA